MKEHRFETHGFGPVYDENSRILILGSFPSVKSREMQFYYGHPQNRFWKLLGMIYGEPVPDSADGRRRFALRNGIALWDSIESCRIVGSSDSSIRDAEPTDIRLILDHAPIARIYANGNTSLKMYQKYQLAHTGREAIGLPSTSPANAAWSLEKLYEVWKQIAE